MRRRQYLLVSGGLLALSSGTVQGTAQTAQDDDEADPHEFVEDPITIDGEGATVTDEFDLEAGVTIAEATHDGESNFIVDLVPADGGREQLLVNVIGDFDGASGTMLDDPGTYLLDVDADGAWELTILQPEAEEDDAQSLPLELEGENPTWDGPYLFDGLATATGTHDGQGNFIVEVLPQEGLFSDLVFNEIGVFEGETTVDAEGVGYVTVEADGPWSLTIE